MCGVFGIMGHPEASRITYLGLYALQHRGQESGGIASVDAGAMFVERGMGQVADLFTEACLDRLPGRSAIGHIRYSTSGSSRLQNAQPIRIESRRGAIPVQLRFDPLQRRDVVLLAKGGWMSRRRCANVLIDARATDAGGGACYYDTPVRLLPDEPTER